MADEVIAKHDNDLELFQPIEVDSGPLKQALELVPRARDDDVRRKDVRKQIAPYAAIMGISTVIWYTITILICAVTGFAVAAGVYSLATMASAAIALGRDPRKSASFDRVPSRPRDWSWKRRVGAVLVFVSGPVIYVNWFIDLVRRSRTELVHDSGGARDYSSAEIMADDRTREVLLPLEHHLRQWRRVIVPPNRWIAAVQSGFAKQSDIDSSYLKRVRRYGTRVRQLKQLAEMLLEIEGPLGNEESRNRQGEHILDQVSLLIEQLDEQLAGIATDSQLLSAQVEVELLATEEVERRLLPAPKDHT